LVNEYQKPKKPWKSKISSYKDLISFGFCRTKVGDSGSTSATTVASKAAKQKKKRKRKSKILFLMKKKNLFFFLL
jgi:hypothetical protein